jgi:alanine racemase
LNRLGLPSADIAQLPARFRPSLLMSHFVASEVPGDPTIARQIERFAALKRQFDGVPLSLCNSSGIFLQVQPSIHHDMVRPGVALYGANPTPWTRNPMRPVVRLDALIVQVRTVEPGESVGYNSTWIAPSRRRIATVSLGYADGYHRTGSATNTRAGGAAIVDGVRCPLVARVSMDLITLDVTDAPGAVRGGTAQFLGPDITVDDVAEHLGTNAYEVLTSLGRRYRRVAVTG